MAGDFYYVPFFMHAWQNGWTLRLDIDYMYLVTANCAFLWIYIKAALVETLIFNTHLFCIDNFDAVFRAVFTWWIKEWDHQSVYGYINFWFKVYDYYDTVVPCYSDTISWLVLKEGETGYYYYDYYHPKLDSATISFSINDIGIPTKTIYSRQVSVCSEFDEFGVLFRDSFVVISENTEDPFPALFTVIVQTGNNQTEEQRMKCFMHHWHR